MSELRFDDRVVLITGAGRGLGRAYAEFLASRGAKIVVNDLPGTGGAASSAVDVVATIAGAGGSAVADVHSVTNPDGAEAMVRLALETYGRIDVIVHNAGMANGTIDDHLAVAVTGGLAVARAAWEYLVSQRYGRLIFTTSGVGLYGRESPQGSTDLGELELYGVAKLAQVALARHLAMRGRAANINVNSIAPIALSHSLLESMPSWDPTPRLEWTKTCTADQVVPVLAWLAHEDCTISGEILRAAGGRVARTFFAETPGIWSGQLTPEAVGLHVKEICAERGYHVPRSADDIPFDLDRSRVYDVPS